MRHTAYNRMKKSILSLLICLSLAFLYPCGATESLHTVSLPASHMPQETIFATHAFSPEQVALPKTFSRNVSFGFLTEKREGSDTLKRGFRSFSLLLLQVLSMRSFPTAVSLSHLHDTNEAVQHFFIISYIHLSDGKKPSSAIIM